MHLGILVVQIKILLLLSFFVFCNVQVLFHDIFFLIFKNKKYRINPSFNASLKKNT